MGYEKDVTMQTIQQYLPKEHQLSNVDMPKEYYIKIDNMNIHIDHYVNESSNKRVILFHGVGGNGRLLSFIALPLWRAGYDVICPDLPLYGYTEYQGRVTYDAWVKCGKKIADLYQKDGIDIILFGLSAGGMLAYQVACLMDNPKGVIATCLLDQRNPIVTESTARHPLFARIGNPVIGVLQKPFGSLKIPMKLVANMKAIVNHKALAKILMKDKHSSGTWVSLDFLHTMLNPHITIEPISFTKCPLLLVHPEKDLWTDISLSRLFFDQLGCKKELKLLKGAGHFPIESEGLKILTEECVSFLEKI